MRSLEIFSGCGGLALGVSEAGFSHALVVERDPHACATLMANKKRGIRHIKEWPLRQQDVREIDYSALSGIDLVSGGPPCQPFSIGGKHHGPEDERNMWPEAIRAVRELRPRAFLFENVRGLLRPAFGQYLTFLRLQLTWPEIKPKRNETWQDQLKRLEAHEKKGGKPTYRVIVKAINAADYGASQKRHRAIMIGIRADIASEVVFPAATHSREALLWAQHITGEYWKRHGISSKKRPPITESDRNILEKLRKLSVRPSEKAWVTVRDILSDLPYPVVDKEPIANHLLHPGARIYVGHTGSIWDEPGKALKAGAHGVPGGENILAPGDGSVRYFTIREMARLQGFPDTFHVSGSWVSCIKQLGNAVPVQVGTIFGKEIYRLIEASYLNELQDAA